MPAILNQDIKIFLLIGQSNMAGRGDIRDVSPISDSQILMFRDAKWQTAIEPLHTDNPDIAGVGLAMSFADELLKVEPALRIGFVPCAVGWTTLQQWMPGSDLYKNAVSTTRLAMRNGSLKGILWHQGENDSFNSSDAGIYGQRLTKMVNELRSDLNAAAVPFIAGELGAFLEKIPDFKFKNLVNRNLQELETTLPLYSFVSADGLTDKGDHLHFDSKSLREFGIRYAKKYLSVGSHFLFSRKT